MRNARVIAASFLVALAYVQPTVARTPGLSTRALGMGDAVRAIGLGTAGIYFNPACMSQITQYAIDTGYGYQANDEVHDFHVSIMDSQTNALVAGGVGYTFSQSRKPNEDFTGHDIRLAVSTAFGDEALRFGMGAGFRYLRVNDHEAPVSMATFDVGAFLSLQRSFHFGIAGQNLVSRSNQHAPPMLGVGAALSVKSLIVSGEATLDFGSRDSVRVSPAFGIEYVTFGALALRAGFSWDRAGRPEQKMVTGGIGYISQYFGVDVGYAHDVQQKENWIIASSIRIFLP